MQRFVLRYVWLSQEAQHPLEGFWAGMAASLALLRELARPGLIQMARDAAANAKCLEFGFKPQTEAYGNCRLQLEQIRATERSSAAFARQQPELMQPAPLFPVQTPPPPVHYLTTVIGKDFTYTTCH